MTDTRTPEQKAADSALIDRLMAGRVAQPGEAAPVERIARLVQPWPPKRRG